MISRRELLTGSLISLISSKADAVIENYWLTEEEKNALKNARKIEYSRGSEKDNKISFTFESSITVNDT